MTFGYKPGQYIEVHLDSGVNPAFDFRKLGICPALEAEYRGFQIDDRLLEGIRIRARQMALELLYEGRQQALIGMPDGIPIIEIQSFGSNLEIVRKFPASTPVEIKWDWEDAFQGPPFPERINLGDVEI